MLKSIVKHRRGTTNEWSATKVVPEEGELVIEELDNGTKKIKLGDGLNLFKDLPYISGSGGTGTDTGKGEMVINYITSSPVYCTTKDSVLLRFEFAGKDSSGDTILEADAVWKVGSTVESSTVVAYSTVFDGAKNNFDITKYLSAGEQNVYLEVKDLNGNSTSKAWRINRVNFSIDSNFDDKRTYTANKDISSFTYYPTGTVPKKATFYLDGDEIGTHETSKNVSDRDVSYAIKGKPHGSYLLKIFLDGTMDNGVALPTVGPAIKDILFVDPDNDEPLVGCNTPEITIKQYETKNIIFTVHDKNADIPEVDIFIDDNETAVSHMYINPNDDFGGTKTGVFPYRGTDIGTHEIKIKCRNQIKKVIKVVVEELAVPITPVTNGLVFDFNPAGKSNDDLSNRFWKYSGIEGEIQMKTSDNFDWNNGGYRTDDPDGPCFLIKAGSTATIDYQLFADEAKICGKEFKVIFKTKNVANPDTVFLTCVDNTTEKDHIGIEMRAQKANIYGKNGNLELIYSEDDVIELEFNISQSSNDVPMIMGYEDGVPSRPLVYDSTFSFQQNSPKEITLGSKDCECDLYIYRIKAYNTALSNIDILNNFIADARNPEDVVTRYTRNQIYTKENKLTPTSVAEACPWLRVYMVEAPYFTNHKDNKVSDTTITQIYKGGDAILDNWTCYKAKHSGQGTSSNNYGAAGRNLDFIMNGDDAYFILGDGKTIAHEITLTRDSVPVAYLNAKVNIASSNNLTNAILANHYNEFNPYRRPFIRPEGYPIANIKDTMEFYNCVIFIKESADDLSKHREFNDKEWHFYAIGNIGDSKKTDNTRATDPNDPYECCVEIMDVKLPLSDFPVDTMINAMAQKKNNKEEWEYVWAKNENLNILYEREFALTEDKQINLNKTYYIDLPVKVAADESQLTNDNLENLYDRVYRLTEDTEVIKDHIYYLDEDGNLASPEFIASITSPVEEGLYEWHKEYKKTTDEAIVEGKPYYVEVLEKTNAMGFTYENVRKYLTATDSNLENLYEFKDGKYIKTPDHHVDLTKTYYTKYEEKNANGDVISTTYTDAMGYVLEQVKVYTYATQENLDNGKLYEVSYFETKDTTVDTSKTYYIDILENDDFSEDYTYGWRYSKDKKNKEITNYCHQRWIEFYRFVTTSTDAEFKAHLKDYFVVDSALYYYLFTERYCMVDNRAKNTFWHYSKTGEVDAEGNPIRKWDLCWDYDNDTSLGLNNYGMQVYRYGLEDTDVDASGDEVFREMDSLFFCRLRDLFGPELKAMYNTLDQVNAWHAESFITRCDEWQEQFPEELWRLDIERKYIRTYTKSFKDGGGDSQFLVNMCNGRMKYQRRHWERNQDQYMASKYQTTRASGDAYHANFRFGGPSSATSEVAVPVNYQLTLTPCSYMYLNVQYGGTTPSTIRVTDANINTPITVPFVGKAADIVNVYSAASIRDFGDLSAAYPRTVSIGNAYRVKKLTLGNNTAGYDNSVFTTLTTDANPLLEEIDVTNISSLTQTLDLHKLINLKKLKAFGTNTSSVLFADGGKLDYAELPAVNSISLKNLQYLSSENFKLENNNYDFVTSLLVDGCPLIDKLDLLEKCTNLIRLRLTNVNLGAVTYEYFKEKIFNLKGIAANGEDTIDNAYISGECYFEELTGDQYNELAFRYPGLKINFGKLYTKVIFMDTYGDKILHEEDLVAENSEPYQYVNYGDDLPTPTLLNRSDKYEYTLDNWTTKKVVIPEEDSEEYKEFKAPEKEENALRDILGIRVVYPAFKNTIRKYKVTFYNPKKSGYEQVGEEMYVEYGTAAIFEGEDPKKLDTANPDKYSFVKWVPDCSVIKGDLDCYATFEINADAWHILDQNDIKDCVTTGDTVSITKVYSTIPSIIQIPDTILIDGKNYTVTKIGSTCFQTLINLEHIKLSKNITTIGSWAFGNCSNLMSIELPENLKTIEFSAFSDCTSLESIYIPKNVSSIGDQVFNTISLTTLEVDKDNEYYSVIHNGNWLIEIATSINGTKTYSLHSCLKSAKDITSVNINDIIIEGRRVNKELGEPIVKLKDYAFSDSNITNVDLTGIKEIGANVFQRCAMLSEVSIPDGCSLGATVFAWCSSLTKVTLPSDLKEIGTYVFTECDIRELVLPESITKISEYAFNTNKNLEKVYIKNIIPSNKDNKWIDARAFNASGANSGITFYVPWSENEIEWYTDKNGILCEYWGAENANIICNYAE